MVMRALNTALAKSGAESQRWLLVVSGLLGLSIAGCSSNGEKDETAEAQQNQPAMVQTTPQGQWVAVQPNMVWVPQGSTSPQQPLPVYPAQPGAPQYAPQQSAVNPDQYAAPAPQKNPWAVAPRSYRDRGPERYATSQPYSQWQPHQPPRSQYRPLEEERYERPQRQQYVPPQPAWSGSAPYDRPVGSSTHPGYPGAATAYGPAYPAYGVSPYGYGYGGVPGAYGGVWPGSPAVMAPGVW